MISSFVRFKSDIYDHESAAAANATQPCRPSSVVPAIETISPNLYWWHFYRRTVNTIIPPNGAAPLLNKYRGNTVFRLWYKLMAQPNVVR